MQIAQHDMNMWQFFLSLPFDAENTRLFALRTLKIQIQKQKLIQKTSVESVYFDRAALLEKVFFNFTEKVDIRGFIKSAAVYS